MKLNLPAIDGRKEIAANQREHDYAQREKQNHRGRNDERDA